MDIEIAADNVLLPGILVIPENASSIVAFAHGSGSSRHSPRNGFVARVLNEAGISTLLLDLLTPEEDSDYAMRFDIELLAGRLVSVSKWLRANARTKNFSIGYFGASTGAAAALQAAASEGDNISAVVSRGGRPDLAGEKELSQVVCPTLLIVGGFDGEVITLNERAFSALNCVKELKIVPGATHLFEEQGKLEIVAQLACDWFGRYLRPAQST